MQYLQVLPRISGRRAALETKVLGQSASGRSWSSWLRRSCGLPVTLEIFYQTREAIDPKPDLDPVFLDVDLLDQQLDDPGLLSREELVPKRVEAFESLAHLGLRDDVVLPLRCAPCPNDDFGGAQIARS